MCTRTSPCANFTTAHAATDAGGQINCLESGSYFGVTITKSITIDCAGVAATSRGIHIDGADIVVKIRNLTFNASGGGAQGIDFRNGAALFVEQCKFEYYTTFPPFIGVRFRPAAAARLVISETSFSHNGGGSVGGGIVISPQSGGSARVSLSRVVVANSVFGIAADGTGSTAGINMTITDSVSTGNSQDGIIAVTPSGGAPIGVMVKNTQTTNNAIGIRSIGPNVTVRVDGSSVIGNGTGLSFSGGGTLLTFGNNAVQSNGTNGAFSGSVGLQ